MMPSETARPQGLRPEGLKYAAHHRLRSSHKYKGEKWRLKGIGNTIFCTSF